MPETANNKSDSTEKGYIPYKSFFALVSFVASVDMALAVAASITLTDRVTFLGRKDQATLDAVYHSAVIFTWSACVNGLAFILSMLAELLFTSPFFQDLLLRGPYKTISTWAVGSAAWMALALVASGTALIAEGLKVVDRRAGTLLQWILLGFGFPVLVFWISVKRLYKPPPYY